MLLNPLGLRTGKIVLRRCFFFDRDGIVNKSPGAGYVERWEDFRIEPAFPPVLKQALEAGYEAVIVTNQRGVALGRVSIKELERIHKELKSLLMRRYALRILDIEYCPHDNNQCDCRKPQPGMFERAASRHGIDLPGSWTVGDSLRDVEAGRRAGCGKTVLVSSASKSQYADFIVPDMEALRKLLAIELTSDLD